MAFVYQREDYFQAQIDYRGQIYTVAVGDTIPLVGKIDLIDAKQVVINTSSGLKTYPTPGNEPIGLKLNLIRLWKWV